MDLKEFEGCRVRLVSAETGKVYVGVVGDYIYPDDNEPEEEGIVLDIPGMPNPIAFDAHEIESIDFC